MLFSLKRVILPSRKASLFISVSSQGFTFALSPGCVPTDFFFLAVFSASVTHPASSKIKTSMKVNIIARME